MGYYVSVTGSHVVIRKANLHSAIDCLRKMIDAAQDRGSGGTYVKGKLSKREYSWVSSERVLKMCEKNDLVGIMDEWGYEFTEGVDSYIMDYRSRDKLGDDDQLWLALSPAIENGCYMNWRGEEGEHWRYEFSDGSVQEMAGEIVWKPVAVNSFDCWR
jgi:hypothetical protein